ncbi:flavodoxin family protein [Actinomadura verrucosospora]|uniref:NADPH-dependent FMN reductase n=1 Tax=Actinomadura verrucosospora TaxID=46165 RepID=A0A7D3ZVG1_ACTVE|nr:NAD(P)H-dependent oxidoreductase [Actinomadura verrucosospora]QKG19906.1 NADPH-dependent FMN reductase [Actinomadura verrucosospora]
MTTRPKIIAINGSIREGNTTAVLRHAAELARRRGTDLETVDLRSLRITATGACGDCNARCTPCTQEDDVPAVVRRMAEADGVILAAPVQGYAVSALMQTFIERAGACHMRFDRPLAGKVGGAIVVARRYSAVEGWAHLTTHLLLNRLVVVGSGFPATVYGLHPGEALRDAEGMTNVERMLHGMIDMIELLDRDRRRTGAEPLAFGEANEREGLRFVAVR